MCFLFFRANLLFFHDTAKPFCIFSFFVTPKYVALLAPILTFVEKYVAPHTPILTFIEKYVALLALIFNFVNNTKYQYWCK